MSSYHARLITANLRYRKYHAGYCISTWLITTRSQAPYTTVWSLPNYPNDRQPMDWIGKQILGPSSVDARSLSDLIRRARRTAAGYSARRGTRRCAVHNQRLATPQCALQQSGPPGCDQKRFKQASRAAAARKTRLRRCKACE